jgi:hypothetical protein
VYLNDSAMIAQAIDGLKMITGSYPGDFEIRSSEDWWYAGWNNEATYLPINPANSSREGHDVSGLIPVEMERGSAQWPPVHTGYPAMVLNGRVVQAVILLEAGKVGPEVWTWGNRALIRAAEAMFRLGGGFADAGMHHNHLLNYYANAGLPEASTTKGRTTWGVDFTHP